MERKLTVWMLLVLFASVSVGTAFAAESFHVGATVSETGHFATEIGPFRKLLQAWVDDTNAQGGLLVGGKKIPVTLTVYDDRSDEATARRMYERLAVVDRVDLMFGPYSSPLTLASSTAAEMHNIPYIAICANSPKIYERGYRWIVCIIDKAPRYTARYWEMIAAEGKASTVAFVVEDTLHPQGVYKGARHLAMEAGLRVLGDHVAPADAKDFSAMMVQLKSADPDIIFISSNIPFAVQFMAQAWEMGVNPREYHAIHHSGIFLRSLGIGAAHVTGQSYWTPGMEGGQHDRFVRLLENAGISLDDYPWAPAYMMAFEVAQAAAANAEAGDKTGYMKALKNAETDTIGGVVTFGPDGAGSINTYPSQIVDGKYVIVWPPEKATGAHVYPRTPFRHDKKSEQ